MLIFEHSREGRFAYSQAPREEMNCDLPESLCRTDFTGLPEVSELDVVRHFTNLSRKNFSIDTQF